MKKFLFICFLFFTISAQANSAAERLALSVPQMTENNMSALAHYLAKGSINKYDQAKAIAIWIASHVAYDNYSLATMEGRNVSNRLKKGEQTAEDVFKTKIGTCEGYANLYSKMLGIVGIQNEKVYGFALDGMKTSAQAKNRVKRERIGHVWNKINIPGHKDILVDITWMSRGQTAQTQKRLTPHMKKQELQKIKRERPTYTYNMKYFDFNYKKLQKNGEYRFLSNYQMLK